MKKVFCIFLGFLLFLSYSLSTDAQLIPSTYSVATAIAGRTVTITLSGPVGQKMFQPIVSEQPITTVPSSTPLTPSLFDKKTIGPSGNAVWEQKLKAGTLYHLRIVEIKTTGVIETRSFLTEDATFTTESVPDEISFKEPVFNKVDDGLYTLFGVINADKHKETDPVPLSSIDISGGFYDKETGALVSQLNPTKPILEEPKTVTIVGQAVTEKFVRGQYSFIIHNNSFNPNTNYNLKLIFKSTTGAYSEHTYTVNTGKGYIIPETGKTAENFLNEHSYRLLAPIPGMTMLLDPELCKIEQETNPGQVCDVNAFLNFMLELLIGIAAVVLVVRLIIDGYGYMTTDIPFKKAALKGSFKEALIGLVVALSSYLILNTINPRLVNNTLTIAPAEFDAEVYPPLDFATYQRITGKVLLPKSQYAAMAQSIAKEVGIDPCLLIATATAESNMNPAAFGSDADFALDIASRNAFINSGIKYSGATFTKGDQGKVLDKSFKNDTPKGQVDWRFSAGFGMLGVTFFPEGYCGNNKNCAWINNPPYSLRDKVPELDTVWPLNQKTGKKYTYLELLDAETSLRLGAGMLQKKSQECKDPYKTLASWNTGGCTKTAIGNDVRKRAYDQCKGN